MDTLHFSCEVIREQKTGESLQYAFIEFENVSSGKQFYLNLNLVPV